MHCQLGIDTLLNFIKPSFSRSLYLEVSTAIEELYFLLLCQYRARFPLIVVQTFDLIAKLAWLEICCCISKKLLNICKCGFKMPLLQQEAFAPILAAHFILQVGI